MDYFLGACKRPWAVLAGVDASTQSTILLSSCLHLNTETGTGEPPTYVLCTYDGTATGFARTVQSLRDHPELRGLVTHDAILEVLECMLTMQLDLSLDLVDGVVIQRIGRQLLCIRREGGQPLSGTTLYLDLNDVRARTADALCKAGAAGHGVAFLTGGVYTLAAVALLGVLAYMKYSRQSF